MAARKWRPLHSGTHDLTQAGTSDPVNSRVRPQLDIRLKPAPGLTRCRTRFCKSATASHFLTHHHACPDRSGTRSHQKPLKQHLCAFVSLWFRRFVANLWGGKRVQSRVNAGSGLQRSLYPRCMPGDIPPPELRTLIRYSFFETPQDN